ncbi:MAG TPA: glucokinase, partial [Arenibacter sp.]|nr:glucokinase [Arenibacter sp.]
IHRGLHIPSVSLINDMEANAYGLAALPEEDFDTLKYGPNIPGNAALISPGTGLGEAGLFWDGSHYHPFASEGGHCDFSPRNDSDVEIWQYFEQKYGHVSWERLISGPGIFDMYLLLRRVSGVKEPQWLKEKLAKEDPSAVISETALDGKDSICTEAMELFIRFLAIEAAHLALKFKATGGIYIGGGILPKIIKRINREIFYANFVQSGRMNSLLQMVPVKVILNEKTALLGAAYYAAMALEKE